MNNVNGITNMSSTTPSYSSKPAASEEIAVTASATSPIDDTAAVYESSSDKTEKQAGTYSKGNTELINKIKIDSEAHIKQLQDIVNQLISKQGIAYDTANGLKKFYESLEVDDATRLQAQKDIAEDGYWGVEQTSSRIFDFAMALSGGDKESMEKMKDAFLKGFDQATKAWGDELPSISKETRDAVLKKFEDYANSEEQ